jgi:hypothetical protein
VETREDSDGNSGSAKVSKLGASGTLSVRVCLPCVGEGVGRHTDGLGYSWLRRWTLMAQALDALGHAKRLAKPCLVEVSFSVV